MIFNLSIVRCDQKIFKHQTSASVFLEGFIFDHIWMCIFSSFCSCEIQNVSSQIFFGDRDRDWEASGGTFIFPLSLGLSDPAGNRRESLCGLMWQGSSSLWVASNMLSHEVIAWFCMITGRFSENPTIIPDKSVFQQCTYCTHIGYPVLFHDMRMTWLLLTSCLQDATVCFLSQVN